MYQPPKVVNVISAMADKSGPNMSMIVEVEFEDGHHEQWPFYYVPTDHADSTKAVTQWLADHSDFAIDPYVLKVRPTPTIWLRRRDIRLLLVAMGLPADAVELALAEAPAGEARERLRVEWMDPPPQGVRRDHPLFEVVLDHWRISPAALDDAWLQTAIALSTAS